MTKKQHKALTVALSYALHKSCKDLHHRKSERHNWNQLCRAERRYFLEIQSAFNVLKELNIKHNCEKASDKSFSTQSAFPPETRITVNGKTFLLADIDNEMIK